MRVRYTPRARGDIEDIFQYIAERNPVGARNVLRAIYAGIDYIAENLQGSMRTDEPGARVKIVSRYRYKIFYRIEGDTIEIIHVRHGSRRAWRGES